MANTLVCGVGINNLIGESGSPIYKIWRNMLSRCYRKDYVETNPSHKAGTVCKDWLIYSNFKSWVEAQGWKKGWQIDKEIICKDNLIFNPDMCVMVPIGISNLLMDSKAIRGKCSLGVEYRKDGKFVAKLKINGTKKFLGVFKNEADAYEAYIKAKSDYIIKMANSLKDIRIREGLIRHAYKIMTSKIEDKL